MAYNVNQGIPREANAWPNWANIVLGVWLFVSPWVLQFAGSAATTAGAAGEATAPSIAVTNASWNAWILGVVIFLVAVSALRATTWQGWVNLVLGAWVFIAPWVLGFAGLQTAAWDHWVVGVLVVLFSIANVAMASQGRFATRGVEARPPRAQEERRAHH